MAVRIDVVSIFPDYLQPLRLSLVGKAIESGLVQLAVHDLRGWTHDRHRTVDDTPYGGGAGMVMRPEPWGEALDDLLQPDRDARLLIMSPSGRRFDQRLADELAGEAHLVFACGRYEGIDARVAAYARSRVRVDEVSIGDYVLNGGEVAALAIIEAVVRLLPGVIGNPESLAEESHSAAHDRLLEYPLYTKPPAWRGLDVPDILFSGHHAQIAAWRREQALELTRERRPDLLPPSPSPQTMSSSAPSSPAPSSPAPSSPTQGPITIARAAVSDAGELLTLQRAAYVSEGRLHNSFDFPPLTDDLDATEQIIATSVCLVARRAGRLVGSVFGVLQDDGGWFIGRLMVAPDLRGVGLGRRLFDEIEAAAPPEAAFSVLVTGANSAFNQAFYTRRGYRITAQEVRGAVPIVVMERDRSSS